MIYFRQLNSNDEHDTKEAGLFFNTKDLAQYLLNCCQCIQVSKREVEIKLEMARKGMVTAYISGNLVDCETWQILSEESIYKLPDWVHDPLIRQLKVEQWKQQKEKEKHGNRNRKRPSASK